MKMYFNLLISFYFHRLLFIFKCKLNLLPENNKIIKITLYDTNTFIPLDGGEQHVVLINGDCEGIGIGYETMEYYETTGAFGDITILN